MRAPAVLLALWWLPAAAVSASDSAAPAATFDHAHPIWQAVLEQDAHGGLVDYRALREEPAALNAYLDAVASVDPGDYTAWTPDQRLAFWLNAVNAFTLKAVVEEYPLKRPWWKPKAYERPSRSVKQDPQFDARVFTAAGQEITLAEARKLVLQLRPDPRLALALTCPCLGGPALPPQAFTPDDVDAQLDLAARRFLTDPKRVAVVDDRAQRLRLSQALQRKEIGDPIVLVSRYAAPETAARLSERGWTIEWLPVDWTLDELAPRGRRSPAR